MNSVWVLLTMLLMMSACGSGSNRAAVIEADAKEVSGIETYDDERSIALEKVVDESADAVDSAYQCGKQSDGSWLDCPEPLVQYSPTFPKLGKYSVAGVCEPFSQKGEVTLQDGESLSHAFDRLTEKGVSTGVILVPWDVDTVQCDRFRAGMTDKMHTLTVKGVLGHNGEQPRFYCRRSDFDGTIAKGKGSTGGLIFVHNKRSLKNGKQQMVSFMLENIHVDGYAQWLHMPTSANIRMRNNYLHHATNNGLTTPDINFYEEEKDGIDLQICGNEISHAGNGNTSHCLYLKRSERASFGTTIDVKFVDNVIHSCNYSSAFKSTANTNLVSGNKFYKHLDTDPSYTKRGTQMMVDTPSCSHSTEISSNLFYYNRVDESWMPGNSMIGIRNRSGIYGCDIPQPQYLKQSVKLPDGSKVICSRAPLNPACAIPESTYWEESYWADQTHEIPIIIKDNVFEVPLDADNADRANPVRSWGSLPHYKLSLGRKACVLPRPEGWYERTMVYLSGNTYINVNPERRALEVPMFTTPGEDWCGNGKLQNTNPADWDLITEGLGEVYLGEDWR